MVKVLSRGPAADAVPLLSILTACDCSVEELERIAAFLETQTLKRWRLIHCSGAIGDWLPAEGMAVLHLPRAPGALRATALEEAIWFLLSRPALPWVELREDARGGDLFVSRRSLSEGRIGARLNGRRHPCSSSLLALGALPRNPGKRLLLLAPWLEPGGADRCNLDMLRAFSQEGWTLTVVASLASEHRWLDRFTALTTDVWVLPDFLAAEKACDFLAYLVDSRQPDLMLLSNSTFAYDVLGFVRNRYPGLPVVDLNHMEEDWGDGGYPGRAARCTALLDRHWVVSRHLRHWLLDRGVEASKVEVLHWFADVDLWKPDSLTRAKVRARLGIAPQCVLIVYAGRLCAQKRPDLFAASLGELARRGGDFVALVLGDGELAGQLRSDLRRRGLAGRVRMLGWQDEGALRELFQASDIFFLPSAGEGIALVLYEAMACGMAIVAADVGGQAELVSAHCGFLVPRSNTEREARDYAARLESLVRGPEMLRRMGRNSARRIREEFTLSLFERRLWELLERVPVSTPCGVCTDSPASGLGAARLSMQWASYRLANRLRCRLDIQKHGRCSRFLERCAKGVFFLRTFGAKALWQKIRKH
ncbi:glycosyltransferase family 1 protein [Pseudomonas aeruginosa]|nr:glycosyltransferase family 1 protein [Pseudomonas aeruginosa]